MDTPVNPVDGDPRVSDAVIGAAIGVLLIYLGTLIPYWIPSWSTIGCGILFVVVMAVFICVTLWNRMSPHIGRLLARARGHVRQDPQLGTLTRDVKGRFWEASLMTRTGSVDVLIEGTDEPTPVLLARAREIVASFDALEARVSEYIAREATTEGKEDPELAAQIRALRVLGDPRGINRPSKRCGDRIQRPRRRSLLVPATTLMASRAAWTTTRKRALCRRCGDGSRVTPDYVGREPVTASA